MIAEVPQTLGYKGGQLNVALVLEVENVTTWKKRFMCHIIGIEPHFKNIISNGHYIPMTAGQRKLEIQWTPNEKKDANSDQRLKSLIMSMLLDDQMNSVINCLTTKSTWDDLILYHEEPSYMKESRIMDLKLCYNTFKFKEEKVISRLSRWKMKTLSIGGRFTLLKSILGSMPIFHMSIFKVPSSILKNLEAIRSRFFNGQEPTSKKASWVKWSQVLTSKEKGGLGVSSLYALNRGLMFKWLWRFYSQKHSLWTKVIKAIYGEDGSFDKVGVSGGRTCWTSIVQEVKVLQDQGVNVHDFIKLKLGNGDSRSGIEETQFNSMVEIVTATTLMPCDDRYD
nr:RNA-directed DNA polymerase, eukaryota, reverse transcriptase zinc-binding domain protein [Tanacetum cinerariifolium]